MQREHLAEVARLAGNGHAQAIETLTDLVNGGWVRVDQVSRGRRRDGCEVHSPGGSCGTDAAERVPPVPR